MVAHMLFKVEQDKFKKKLSTIFFVDLLSLNLNQITYLNEE